MPRRSTRRREETEASPELSISPSLQGEATDGVEDDAKAIVAAPPATGKSHTISELTTTSTRPKASRLPAALQLPLVVVLSFATSALGYAAVNQWTRGELAVWAKTLETWGEVLTLIGWKMIQLSVGWYGNLDSYDLGALSLLSHGPTLHLLTTFYGISPLTTASCLAVDVASSFLPFLLLRPLSIAHSADPTVRNRDVIVDRSIQAYTTLLAGAVYSVTLSVAYLTYIPRTLVLYFDGIPSIEAAYQATNFLFVSVPSLVLSLAFGLAARSFIFTPAATTAPAPADPAALDPVTATVGGTALLSLRGLTAQTKVVVVRTAIIMLLVGVTTFLQCSMTIRGIEPVGAALYASVWVVAAAVTGLGLGVVGKDAAGL